MQDTATTKRPLDTLASHGKATETQGDPLDLLEMPRHAQVYAAAAPTQRPRRRLYLAGAVAGAILLIGLPTAYWVASLQGPRLFVPAAPQAPLAGAHAAMQREAWLTDVLAAQTAIQAAQAWEPAGRSPAPPATSQRPPRPVAQAAEESTNRKQKRSSTKRRDIAKGIPDEVTDPDYAALFGSASRYAEASAHASSRRVVTIQDAAKGRAIKGQLLHARLIDEVVSQPVGSAVIAALSRTTKLGDITLPAGAELHGTVRGAGGSGDRILMHFGFARLASGETYDITGVARDVRGRQGIAGRKLFDARTAGSVGLAAASKLAQAAGRQVSSAVGEVLGAGIDGFSESGREKVKRLDQDETTVVVSPGTRFDVYVTAIGEKRD